MPRVEHVIVYKFSELSEDGKKKVLSNQLCINVSNGWWEYISEDAKQVSLEISGFDTDRRDIDISFTETETETAHLILKEHGKGCDTYLLAESFLKEYNKTIESKDENQIDFDIPNICEDFKGKLGLEYLKMLENEYEYKIADSAIIETIEANEYEFTADGKMY